MEHRGIAPDLHRFFVPIELDRPRVLAFDSAATFLVYRKYGTGFWRRLYEPDIEAGKGTFRIASHEALEYFLWAGLQRDAKAAGETLTLEDAAALIVPTSIEEIAQALLVALSATRQPQKK